MINKKEWDELTPDQQWQYVEQLQRSDLVVVKVPDSMSPEKRAEISQILEKLGDNFGGVSIPSRDVSLGYTCEIEDDESEFDTDIWERIREGAKLAGFRRIEI